MNDKREVDRAVDRWLDTGSDATPPKLIDAVLLAVRSTPQERDLRLSWRTAPLKRRLYAVAAVAALAVGVTWIGSGPTPPEEPSVGLGIFEPVAGKIVYGDEQGIWGVDPAAPADPATRVQLTSEPGIPLGWSRDGTRLLVMRGSSPDEHLIVLDADGSETWVTERPMSIIGAALSPDGSRVVFAASTSDTGSALYAVDADGGPAERLFGPGEHLIQQPTFSPDGTRIAYAFGGGDHSNNVWLMDADGNDPHPIVSNESDEWPGHVRGLAWSPAGDQIALGLGGKIYTFATNGSDFTEIAGADTTCESARSCAVNLPSSAESPYWSPDGSQIAYTTGCVEGAGSANRAGCALAIVDADGSNVREFSYGASGPWHQGEDAEDLSPTPMPTELRRDGEAIGELVLHFHSWRDGYVEVAVYADGRVIWVTDERAGNLQQQLTPEGVGRLRSRAEATGLFEQDLALGLDLGIGNLEVRRGDRSVIVAWGTAPVNVSGLGLEDRFVEATPAQASVLTELEAFFRDPTAWGLPRDMYRQAEITQFVPTHLAFGYDQAVPDLSILPSPAHDIVASHLEPVRSDKCNVISIDQAREVVDALVQAEVIDPIDDITRGFAFDLGPSFVWFDPALPHEVDCP